MNTAHWDILRETACHQNSAIYARSRSGISASGLARLQVVVRTSARIECLRELLVDSEALAEQLLEIIIMVNRASLASTAQEIIQPPGHFVLDFVPQPRIRRRRLFCRIMINR